MKISAKQFLWSAVIVAVLAFLMQAIDQWLAANTIIGSLLAGGGSWIAFQAWAVYFLGGCDVKGGIKGFIAYAVGIGVSIGIMTLGGSLSASGLGFFGVPVAVLLLVIPTIYCERVEILSYVPALFVGAGAYFGIMGYIAGSPAVAPEFAGNFWAFAAVELFYCLFGLVWGFLTIKIRGTYEASLTKDKAA